MCGRVYSTLNVGQLLRAAGTSRVRNRNRHQCSYNMGPATYVPAVRHSSSSDGNHRELDMVKWGYQAPFGQFIINARIEEAAEKRTFKNLVDTARCVMIIEGYFEWSPNKEPHVFRPKENKKEKKDEKPKAKKEKKEKKEDNEEDVETKGNEDDDDWDSDVPPVMYIAGLIAPDDTLMVLTREALRGLHEVHERMPVILDESEIDMWLDCDKYKFEKILHSEILNEKKDKWNQIFHYEIGPLVNNMKNKSEKIILSLEDYKKDLDKTGIKRFFQPVKKEKAKGEEKKEEEKKIEEKRDSGREKKDHASGKQATQSTMATDLADEYEDVEEEEEKSDKKNEQTDIERAQERAERTRTRGKGDDEDGESDDPDLDHMQDTIDKSGLGKDKGGFKATKIHVMTRRGAKNQDEEEEESGAKRSKKRKEPTNKDETQQGNRKQVKRNAGDEE